MDPEASEILIQADVKKIILPLDATTSALFTKDDAARIAALGNPYAEFFASLMTHFIDRITALGISNNEDSVCREIAIHADQISSNVLSSFNALQDENLLLERLEYVKKHISKYRENNLHGIVYFEDAHYHNGSIRKLCLETIYPEVDIVSLNEEELKYTLEMYHQPIDSEDILSCTAGCRYIKEHFHIRKGVIVHTKDYSMGTTIFYSALIISLNLVCDILYQVVDPRIHMN